MKKYICFLLVFTALTGTSQEMTKAVSIIPEPVSVTQTTGIFTLPSTVQIDIPSGPDFLYLTQLLQQKITAATGYRVNTVNQLSSAPIRFRILNQRDDQLGNEGYVL